MAKLDKENGLENGRIYNEIRKNLDSHFGTFSKPEIA